MILTLSSYDSSSMKWNMANKIKELSEPGMYQVVLRDDERIACFMSLLSCKEANLKRKLIPVAYIYEFHVLPECQGKGLGAWMMSILKRIHEVPEFSACQKLMLTCQRGNTKALAFYQKHGFVPDEICPSRCLSKTEAIQTGYYILSQSIKNITTRQA